MVFLLDHHKLHWRSYDFQYQINLLCETYNLGMQQFPNCNAERYAWLSTSTGNLWKTMMSFWAFKYVYRLCATPYLHNLEPLQTIKGLVWNDL